MDNTKLTTMPLDDYYDLKKYERAFRENECIIRINMYIGSSDFTTVAIVGTNEALNIVIATNRKLQEEIEALKDRKWYQKIWNT